MRKHIRILILAAAIAAGVVAFTSQKHSYPDPSQECPCEPGNPCYPKCRETSNQ